MTSSDPKDEIITVRIDTGGKGVKRVEKCNIIAEGFQFMPENLSAQHMGWLGAILMLVVARERAQS